MPLISNCTLGTRLIIACCLSALAFANSPAVLLRSEKTVAGKPLLAADCLLTPMRF
mgnify:CR=1 FL=1